MLDELIVRREALRARLQKLGREASPYHVEGFEYTHWRAASITRGALTRMLWRALDQVDEAIECEVAA